MWHFTTQVNKFFILHFFEKGNYFRTLDNLGITFNWFPKIQYSLTNVRIFLVLLLQESLPLALFQQEPQQFQSLFLAYWAPVHRKLPLERVLSKLNTWWEQTFRMYINLLRSWSIYSTFYPTRNKWFSFSVFYKFMTHNNDFLDTEKCMCRIPHFEKNFLQVLEF